MKFLECRTCCVWGFMANKNIFKKFKISTLSCLGEASRMCLRTSWNTMQLIIEGATYIILILNGNTSCWKLRLQNLAHTNITFQSFPTAKSFHRNFHHFLFILMFQTYKKFVCDEFAEILPQTLYGIRNFIICRWRSSVLYQVLVSISSSSSFSKKLICYLIDATDNSIEINKMESS